VEYADHDTDATRHDAASRALDAVYDGEFGHPYLTDIFDEAITLTRKRTGPYRAAKQLSARLLGEWQYPSVYEILYVSEAGLRDAVDVFDRYDDPDLSFTDETIVTVAERFDIDQVLSFDADFDGVVPRVDPGDV
jgi:predicted nucleic acid-binding protein